MSVRVSSVGQYRQYRQYKQASSVSQLHNLDCLHQRINMKIAAPSLLRHKSKILVNITSVHIDDIVK